MYTFVLASSCFICYLVYIFIFTQHPIIKSIIGVKVNNDRELIALNGDTGHYHHVVVKYTLNGCNYCIVSESKNYIISNVIDNTNYITSATLYIDDFDIDVTEKLQQIAGPRCDYHDEPIDFTWIFPGCDGNIEIIYNNSLCSINIPKNNVVSGENLFIPLYDYDDVNTLN
jgi:hypothetical protein